MRLGAHGSVGHVEFTVNVCILRRGHLEVVDGESLVVLARHGRLVIEVGTDALVLERTLAQGIALAKAVGAAPAVEVVVAVRVEGARLEPAPVVASRLLWRTLVVCVARALV